MRLWTACITDGVVLISVSCSLPEYSVSSSGIVVSSSVSIFLDRGENIELLAVRGRSSDVFG